MANETAYTVVTSADEKLSVFNDLLGSHPSIMGLAADNVVFGLKPLRIEGESLYVELEGVPQRTLLASESLALVFGLASGQYLFHGKMALKGTDLYAVKISAELQRMQRRSSFRAVVTSGYPVQFKAQTASEAPHLYQVYDISAGGLGLYIPAREAPRLKLGMILKGQLKFQDGEDLNLRAEVKHVFPPQPNGAYKAGLQFLDLAHSEQQLLFMICVKIHRQTAAHFLR